MALKQIPNSLSAPDGSHYVVLTDGSGNLVAATTGTGLVTKEIRSSTGTETNVASSASNVVILAANANRLGATIYNDSSSLMYLLVAAGTSSSSLYTVQMASQSFFEVPFNYTGIISGIWASATGNARVTEYT